MLWFDKYSFQTYQLSVWTNGVVNIWERDDRAAGRPAIPSATSQSKNAVNDAVLSASNGIKNTYLVREIKMPGNGVTRRLSATSAARTGNDGADALCAIQDVGGITIAQKLDSAAHPDMPMSAIETGCIDFILAPKDIARQIIQLTHR